MKRFRAAKRQFLLDMRDNYDDESSTSYAVPSEEKAHLAVKYSDKANSETKIWARVFQILVDNNRSTEKGVPSSRDQFQDWLRACRLVSKNFDAILKQETYKQMNLDGDYTIGRLLNEPQTAKVFIENFRKFTSRVEFPASPDPRIADCLTSMITGCQSLELIHFNLQKARNSIYREEFGDLYLMSFWLERFIGAYKDAGAYKISTNRDTLDIRKRKVLPSEAQRWGVNSELYSIPEAVETGLRRPILELEVECLLVNGLPSTHLVSTGQQRLPPMIILILRDYDWVHDHSNFSDVWDFSQLRSLTLCLMSLLKFVNEVPLGSLSQLKHFSVLECPPDSPAENATVARRLIAHFAGMNRLKMLRVIGSYWWDYFPKDTLLPILRGLRSLQLSQNEFCPKPMPVAYMAEILSHCHSLREVQLDFNGAGAETRPYLELLVSIPQIKSILLWTEAKNIPSSVYRKCSDPDYEAAKELMMMVHGLRPGLTVTLHVVDSILPATWREKASDKWWNRFHSVRTYTSRMDEDVYSQDGSPRCGMVWAEIKDGVVVAVNQRAIHKRLKGWLKKLCIKVVKHL